MGLSAELRVSQSLEEFRVPVRAMDDGQYAFQIFRVGGEPRTLRRRRAVRPPSRRDDAGAVSAALVIFVALLCVAMLAIFGILWAALHFGVGHDDDD
jgi:hypothetical protein